MPRNLPKSATFTAILALILAFNVLVLTSASAEFFGCNDKPGRVLASYTSGRSGGYTHEFAAQARPRITIYPRQTQPGRNARRQCRSWLVKEYRVSGPVIVPHQQCWWE